MSAEQNLPNTPPAPAPSQVRVPSARAPRASLKGAAGKVGGFLSSAKDAYDGYKGQQAAEKEYNNRVNDPGMTEAQEDASLAREGRAFKGAAAKWVAGAVRNVPKYGDKAAKAVGAIDKLTDNPVINHAAGVDHQAYSRAGETLGEKGQHLLESVNGTASRTKEMEGELAEKQSQRIFREMQRRREQKTAAPHAQTAESSGQPGKRQTSARQYNESHKAKQAPRPNQRGQSVQPG